jgi:hypothetical protein
MLPRLALLAGGALLFPFGCEPADPVILALDGAEVRRSEFERRLAAIEAQGLGPLLPEARRGVLESFLEERTLILEARARGLVAADARPEDEQRAVGRLLMQGAPAPEVTEEEIEAYYRAHAAELGQPEIVTLRQIFVPTLNEARDLLRRLWRDPTSFDVLARTRSRGPEASSGGYMGSFARGQLPTELEEAAFAMRVGGTSDVVETSLGYHVLRVEARQAARELTLEEAGALIRDRLRRDKAEAAQRAFVAAVLARAKVNHEAALRPIPSR